MSENKVIKVESAEVVDHPEIGLDNGVIILPHLDEEAVEFGRKMATRDEKFIDWLDKHPTLDNLYHWCRRTKWKLRDFFAPKYPLTKEHKKAGFTRKDRPLRRYDSFEAQMVLAWITFPVLIRFRQNPYSMGYPANFNNSEEWNDVLDKMIYAFQEIIEDEYSWGDNWKEVADKVQEGLDLYAEYFRNLWD